MCRFRQSVWPPPGHRAGCRDQQELPVRLGAGPGGVRGCRSLCDGHRCAHRQERQPLRRCGHHEPWGGRCRHVPPAGLQRRPFLSRIEKTGAGFILRLLFFWNAVREFRPKVAKTARSPSSLCPPGGAGGFTGGAYQRAPRFPKSAGPVPPGGSRRPPRPGSGGGPGTSLRPRTGPDGTAGQTPGPCRRHR